MRYRDKLDWVRKHATGRKVLYLGSVDDDRENIRKHGLSLDAVRGFAGEVMAVCHSPEEAARLTNAGIHAVQADPERLELGEEFEIVLALDNLEHLSNPGAFLGGIVSHLGESGRLLITTPNPLGLVRIGESLFARRGRANAGHTCWFTGQVLGQLAARYRLRLAGEVMIDDMYAYHGRRAGERWLSPVRLARPALRALNFLICLLLPRFSETNGYLLERRTGESEARALPAEAREW
jgi:hypothetical protein